MNSFIHELTRLLINYRDVPNVEIEIRLGWKQSGCFDTNITEKNFKEIMNILDVSSQNNVMRKRHEYTDVYIDLHTNTRVVINKQTNTKQSCVKKRIEVVDFAIDDTPYDVRISVCAEIPNSKYETLQFLRTRERTSYVHDIWTYDITKSTLIRPINDTTTVFECEIEINVPMMNAYKINSLFIAESGYNKLCDIIQMNTEQLHLKKCTLISNKRYQYNLQ